MIQDRRDSSRRRPVRNAVPCEDLAGLSLAELREYRHRITAEEDRVSYWRRLAHARIDILEAESHAGGSLSFEQLVEALGDTGSGSNRRALTRVKAADPLPDLPQLNEMWSKTSDRLDAHERAEALEQIRTAERQLTQYRRALHERIDEATAELIVRYRQDPRRAFAVLPRR